MSGIYGILSKRKTSEVYNLFYSSLKNSTIKEEKSYNNFLYGRSVIPKFLNDRVLYEDDDIIIGFEGLLFNKDEKNSSETIKKWYYKKGISFINDLEGQFSGFLFDKKDNKLYVYNDQLSTKPIYYYSNKDLFIFASELKVITGLLDKFEVSKELDKDAIYSMITFGYMLDDITYEKNTKKLPSSSYIEIDTEYNILLEKYHTFVKKEDFTLSKEEIIEKIDDLLVKSVKKCWNKNKEYDYNNYAFLSGGLDSRVNLFLAKELGFKKINTFTFSQSNSSDDLISKEIAKKEDFTHTFFPLDNGEYLEKDYSSYVCANDGLCILSGSAAGFNILDNMNDDNLASLHTGQIGDVLFGSFVTDKYNIETGMISNMFECINKISFIDNFKTKYNDNSELFSYEQRQPNNTLNGDRTLSHFVDMMSPFYDKELIEFCLTIPDKFKKSEAIYLDWFNAKHKLISEYSWESAGIKPKNIFLVNLSKNIKRYKNGILRRLGFNINDMNPFDVWIRNNPKILLNLEKEYNDNINNIKDEELKKLLIEMYNTDIKYSHYGRNNKFLVVTLLIALKIHFGK